MFHFFSFSFFTLCLYWSFVCLCVYDFYINWIWCVFENIVGYNFNQELQLEIYDKDKPFNFSCWQSSQFDFVLPLTIFSGSHIEPDSLIPEIWSMWRIFTWVFGSCFFLETVDRDVSELSSPCRLGICQLSQSAKLTFIHSRLSSSLVWQRGMFLFFYHFLRLVEWDSVSCKQQFNTAFRPGF